jgi:transcription antitermination factor NusG
MHSCLSLKGLISGKDRKKLVSFPLFPGYLFVHIRRTYEEMFAVLKAYGVVRFIGIIRCEPVPDEQIVSLKKLVES